MLSEIISFRTLQPLLGAFREQIVTLELKHALYLLQSATCGFLGMEGELTHIKGFL